MLALALLISACSAEPAEKQCVELGTVKWTRDHGAALALSTQTGKPIFLFFQEVPG